MKENYWNESTDALVVKWKTASRREQFETYNALLKPVKYMALSILHRWFIINNSDRNDVLQSAVDHLFSVLHQYNPDYRKSAFAFCGTVLRHYFNDNVLHKRKHAIRIEFLDNMESDEAVFMYSYTYNPFEENHEYDFDMLFNRLEKARWNLLSYVSTKTKKFRRSAKGLDTESKFLNNIVEFLHEHKDAQGLSRMDIHDYLALRMNVSEGTINNYMLKHLGISGMSVEKSQDKVAEKIEEECTWMLDDHDPSVQDWEKHQTRKYSIDNKKYIYM